MTLTSAPVDQAPSPRRSPSPWIWLVVVFVAIVAAGGVIGLILTLAKNSNATASTKPASPGTMHVAGKFDLYTGTFGGSEWEPCSGSGGYSDIGQGTQVVVSDANGKTLGSGSLSAGTWSTDDPTQLNACDFAFSFDVPTSTGPYSIEISHRGRIVFNQSDAGHLALSLGDN